MILLIYIFLLHWFGDFLYQTEWMANNKSHNLFALTTHVLAYTATLSLGLLATHYDFYNFTFVQFFLVNFAAHWVTDFFTSKLTSHMKQQGRIRDFFLVFGFDQFIHVATLVFTTSVFLGVP